MVRSIAHVQPVALRSQLIASRRDFDRLIQGYESLSAISYVVSTDLLLELFHAHGLWQAEVIVGENLSGEGLVEQYRQSLKRKGTSVTTSLAELVKQDRLRVLVPHRTIHSKLYILSGPSGHRVVQGSANLTETARQAANQINYVWYADVGADDPWLAGVLADYEAHRKDCQLFMGDLADLLRHSTDADTQAVVEGWLNNSAGEANDAEARKVLQDLAARTLRHVQDDGARLYSQPA